MTGCILRPNFNWKRLKEAGLVEDVLNRTVEKVMFSNALEGVNIPYTKGADTEQVSMVRSSRLVFMDAINRRLTFITLLLIPEIGNIDLKTQYDRQLK